MSTAMERPTERDLEAARRLGPFYVDCWLDAAVHPLACMLMKYRVEVEAEARGDVCDGEHDGPCPAWHDGGFETVICSAIRLSDGRIFRGHRHHDCIRTAHDLVEHQEPGSWDAKHRAHEQGFITSRNRYVDREEGLRLQKAAGIESACRSGYRARDLFSEDLY